MMTEVPEVRQIPGEGKRRWFSGDGFDLIVWYKGQSIMGFQLCYDQRHPPRALTWTVDSGLRHHVMDDGDVTGTGMKRTPILIPDKRPDMTALLKQFQPSADNLPADIRNIVLGIFTTLPSI